jgi:hypothetical protein
MGLLKPATGGSYLKAGFLGFAGSGKTHTSVELAIGTRKMFGLDGPIAMFDTESGSDFWKERVRNETGKDLLVCKGRSLADLMAVCRESIAEGVSVLIVDSITHVWREVGAAYLIEKQANQKRYNRRVSDKLEFQDWSRIKTQWAQWPDWYLNSPMHVIVCGRAGYEYDMEKDEDGRNELIKTGIKMKVEGEFGFEPSLLVEMQRSFAVDRKGVMTDERAVINRAVVLKDRYGLIDGKTCDDPTFAFFKAHVERLSASEHAPTNTDVKTEFRLDAEGRDDFQKERAQRTIVSEKIKAAFQMVGMDGNSADEKKRRAEALKKYWATTSWTELSENIASAKLESGLSRFETDMQLAPAEAT